MTHKSLNLGKLLKFFELGEAGLQSALRAELRAERES